MRTREPLSANGFQDHLHLSRQLAIRITWFISMY